MDINIYIYEFIDTPHNVCNEINFNLIEKLNFFLGAGKNLQLNFPLAHIPINLFHFSLQMISYYPLSVSTDALRARESSVLTICGV